MKREGPSFVSWLAGLLAYGRAGGDRCAHCGEPGGDERVAATLRDSDTPRAARASRLCAPCRRLEMVEDVRHARRSDRM